MDKLVELIFKRLEFLPTSIGNIVGGIAAIAALFYVGNRVWQNMTKGEPIEIYPLLRPFAIAIILFAFPKLVITPIHYILSPTRTATAQIVYNRKDINAAKIEEIKQKVEAQRAAEAEKEAIAKKEMIKKGGLQAMTAIFDSIGDLFNQFGNWLARKFISGLLWSLECIAILIGLFFKLLRIVFLVVLGCVGPIALALSLFPSYESSFGGWLSKYIGIYLWLPLINILEIIGQEIEVQVMYAMIGGGAVFPPETGVNIVMILMFVVIIFAHLQIPDMAGWIIQGGSITLQAMTGAMAMAGGVAGAGAGAAVGWGLNKSGATKAWNNSIIGQFFTRSEGGKK
jgi:conjugative transposon TraJ protein